MTLYEQCAALSVGPQLSPDPGADPSPRLPLIGGASHHTTVPAFLPQGEPDWVRRSERTVFYISDLHLVHHILHQFPEGASDDQVRGYVQSIADGLFEGEFGQAIREFRSPIVLFGGDVSSSFAIAAGFYRAFIAAWERITDEQFQFCSASLAPIRAEQEQAREAIAQWKDSHSWTQKAQKPLEEYSGKKVPQRIKDLLLRERELKSAEDAKRKELGLGYDWESDYKRARKHRYVYTVLGNHELWDFPSYDACVAAYRSLFDDLHITFPCDQICWFGRRRLPGQFIKDRKTGKEKWTLLNREDDPEGYDAQMFDSENMILVGGLGFAPRNPRFNADQGIYGRAVSRQEELERGETWRNTYHRALAYARDARCSLVVLTHTPFTDWGGPSDAAANCVFFSGHTHRNMAWAEENNSFLFADNQVGYLGKPIRFKKAVLHHPRDPFAADPDGVREITCEEFKESHLYVREKVPGTGTLERQIRQHGANLYVIKKDGYLGFFLVTPKSVCICNGGSIKKVGPPEPLDRYYANFSTMVNKYLTAMSPLRRAQDQVSAYVKSFGGTGKIHGTIVDIDFTNHIMFNMEDGTLTPYYAPMFGLVQTYSSIAALISAQCPQLGPRFSAVSTGSLAVIGPETDERNGALTSVDIKNSQYTVSRRANALQRLFDRRILRDWNPDLEEFKRN